MSDVYSAGVIFECCKLNGCSNRMYDCSRDLSGLGPYNTLKQMVAISSAFFTDRCLQFLVSPDFYFVQENVK